MEQEKKINLGKKLMDRGKTKTRRKSRASYFKSRVSVKLSWKSRDVE